MPMGKPIRSAGSMPSHHRHRSRRCSVTPLTSIPATAYGRDREDTVTNFDNRIFKNGILTLLLVLMGVALLYAYRAQSPSAAVVSYDKAITEIRSGQVKQVNLGTESATIDKIDGSHEAVNIGTDTSGTFQKTVLHHNATHPPNSQGTPHITNESHTSGMI